MIQNQKRIFTVGITGASGAQYGVTLVKELLRQSFSVHLVITEAGWRVFKEELQLNTEHREALLEDMFNEGYEHLTVHDLWDVGASIASGSFRTEGMIIIPCSMGTLSGIAHGASGNLLERAADVMLKEGRKLVIVPRETPLHQIHLENMLKLTKMGATILPAMPGFYHLPESLDDLVRFVVGKALDRLEVPHQLFKRWGEQ
ncbi:UbiX family flavin prenyltransferase [Alkalihalobacillus pseudalcaliphilus]|uniref:UbiX family flavin prenyltransferase n=1 Tax=Alkalihalobacillus pseudalcaliphilus TaxID=79884 RepID=UPI00064E044F|nr:flavin prenyltransferase UbiX [Alkalihalobacillus pseudalcaliphilus]KMK76445.1 aromatic acid decarboxylase [Alkalihalobacillus pseudalcaliphilus]